MRHELRWYQKDVGKGIIQAWNEKETPYANMMTGTGKSLVLADLTHRAMKRGYRVLQLVPTMELCQQNYEEAYHYIENKHDIGLYCAGLNKRQGHKKVVIAMVDSILNSRFKCGAFDIVLIDECDLVSYDPKSKYQKIIKALKQLNPGLRIAGVTGSPYRMGTGVLENPHHEHGASIFTKRAFCTDKHIHRLIEEGYLSHIVSLSGDVKADLEGVKLNSLGDYNTEMMAVKFDQIIPHAVRDMVVKLDAYGIDTALVFASNLANARRIVDEYKDVTGLDNIRIVTGESEKKHERKQNISWLSQSTGRRIIVNVGILTRGYNYRQLDCIVFMRATQSLSLYVQCVGRVIRAHEEKEQGYVIDYGGNIDRHGAIDDINVPVPKTKDGKANKKQCTAIAEKIIVKTIEEIDYTLIPGLPCGFLNHNSAKKCALCDSEFIPDPDAPGQYKMRTQAEILRLKEEKKIHRHEITETWADSQASKGGEPMLVLKHYAGEKLVYKQYLMLDKKGMPRQQAITFLKQWVRDKAHIQELYEDGSMNVQSMVDLLSDQAIMKRYFKNITAITLKSKPDSKYKDLVSVEFE